MESLPLRDIHLPDPIGWWPLAPGWWGVLILALLTSFGLAYWRHRRLRGPTAVQAARAELDRLEADTAMPAREKLQALSILMKRVAISLYPREEVARLSGEEWGRWLAEKAGDDQILVVMGTRDLQAPYQPNPPADVVGQLINTYRTWLSLVHH
jgi:hypothetical protein